MQDTYYFDREAALRNASELRKAAGGYWLQCCYYDGEKIETSLPNLFHLPFSSLVRNLAESIHRFPTLVSFEGLSIPLSETKKITEEFNISLEQARVFRNKLNIFYHKSLLNSRLDFSEPWRFFLHGHSNTTVMRHVSENLSRALENLGYDVFFQLNQGTEDDHCFRQEYEFDPHVTVNINHLNHWISEDVFNFVWIQDPQHWFVDEGKSVSLRERDKIFHLTEYMDHLLQKKGIKSEYQPFCVNRELFKRRDHIEREKKIIMIGSSYKSKWDRIQKKEKYRICEQVLNHYINEGHISREERIKIQHDNSELSEFEIESIIIYVERDLILKHILRMDLGVEFEIYGYGWDSDIDFQPYYKGTLEYGEDVSKKYNSAKYALVIGAYVLQQRTLEAAASGAIPLVYEVNEVEEIREKDTFSRSLLFFKKPEDLRKLIRDDCTLDLEFIVRSNDYQKFASRILESVERDLQSNRI